MEELIVDIKRMVNVLQEKKNKLFMDFLEKAKEEFLKDDDYNCFSTFIDDQNYQDVYNAIDLTTEGIEDVFTEDRYTDFERLANEEKEEVKMTKTEKDIKHIFKDRKLTMEEITGLIEYIEEQKEM